MIPEKDGMNIFAFVSVTIAIISETVKLMLLIKCLINAKEKLF